MLKFMYHYATLTLMEATDVLKVDLKVVAEKFCDLFEQYSKQPIQIDRMDPAYRVGFSDLSVYFPDLHILDRIELDPLIKNAMRRRKLSFKDR